jgi:FkbM family methyltransferase
MSGITHEQYLLCQSVFINRLYHEHGIGLDFEQILRVGYERFLRPGNRVVEAGAHAGKHTPRIAALVGPAGTVYAFEPLPTVHDKLRTALEGVSNITLYSIALGRTQGNAKFVVAEDSLEESGLQVKPFYISGESRTRTIDVRVETLDALALDADYLKLDMEGGELDCLHGATALIERCKPIISAEYHQNSYSGYGYLRESLFEFATQMGYAVFDIFGNRIETCDLWHQICDRTEFWDYWLCPLERAVWFIRTLQRNVVFRRKNLDVGA